MTVLQVSGVDVAGHRWVVRSDGSDGDVPDVLRGLDLAHATPDALLDRLSGVRTTAFAVVVIEAPLGDSTPALSIFQVPLRLEGEPLEDLDTTALERTLLQGFPSGRWRVDARAREGGAVLAVDGDERPPAVLLDVLRAGPERALGAWLEALRQREAEGLAWQLRRLGGNLAAMETEVLRRAAAIDEDPLGVAAIGLAALRRASEAGLALHRAAYQPSAEHPWHLVTVDMAGSRFAELEDVRRALEAFRERRRLAFDAINGAVAAAQVRRADTEQRLQADVARMGSLILIPSLVAAFFGANVGLPYRDSVVGLLLLVTLAGAASLVALGVVRRRYPPPPRERTTASVRRSWRAVVSGPGGTSLLVGAGLACLAVVIVLTAVASGDILPPSEDPVVQRLDELIEVERRQP